MRTIDKLPYVEVDLAMRLLAAVGSAGPHSTSASGVVASKLCSVLGARVCLIGEVPVDVASVKMPWRPRAEFGWRDDRQRHAIFSSLDDPSAHDPTVISLLDRAKPPVTTYSRRELVQDEPWYSSRYFASYRKGSGLDDQAFSLWTDLPKPGWMGIIGLHRDASDPPFDPERLALFELLHRQLAPWLWLDESGDVHVKPLHNGTSAGVLNNHNGQSSALGSGLTAAQRRVLPYLLQGYKEEKIAELLCRSRHTVHDHAMAIYREYGVHNRVELMLRFSGDGEVGGLGENEGAPSPGPRGPSFPPTPEPGRG